MEIVTAQDMEFDGPGDWSSMDFGESSDHHSTVERTPGLHVSDVVHDLCKSAGFVPDEVDSRGWDKKAIWELGFCWEHLIQCAWRERRVFENRQRRILSQPPLRLPLGKGRVLHGTPDAWDFIARVEESYKSSTKNMLAFEREPLSNFWGWFISSKVYSWGLHCGTTNRELPKSIQVRFFVLWLRGDYRHPSARQRLYVLRFSRQEVMEAWQMVRSHAIRMLKKGQVKEK